MDKSIFSDNQQEQNNVPSQITYSDDVNSDDYVAQFLNILYLPSGDERGSVENIVHIQSPIMEIMEDLDVQINESQIGSFQVGQKKSSFHNFQKHLVTTLKNCIDLSDFPQNPQTKGLEKKLWEFFMKCNKNTRTLLYLISGGIDLESKKNKKLQRQYGLAKVIKNQKIQHIVEAQKNLRQQILKHSADINLDEELNQRRIKDKDNFKMYFYAFLEELKSGKLNKRVPKEKKISVENKIFKTKQQDFQGLSFNKA